MSFLDELEGVVTWDGICFLAAAPGGGVAGERGGGVRGVGAEVGEQ